MRTISVVHMTESGNEDSCATAYELPQGDATEVDAKQNKAQQIPMKPPVDNMDKTS